MSFRTTRMLLLCSLLCLPFVAIQAQEGEEIFETIATELTDTIEGAIEQIEADSTLEAPISELAEAAEPVEPVFQLSASELKLDIESSGYKKMLKESVVLSGMNSDYQALAKAWSAFNKKSNKPDAAYRMGEILMKLRDYDRAAIWFSRCSRLEGKKLKFPLALYHQGVCEMQAGHPQLALNSFQSFSRVNSSQKGIIPMKSLSRRHVQACTSQLEEKQVQSRFQMKHIKAEASSLSENYLPLNPSGSAQSFDDFHRLRSIGQIDSSLKMRAYADHRVALKTGSYFDLDFNRIIPFYQGNTSYSVDGRTRYISACEQSVMGIANCRIMRSQLGADGVWGIPSELGKEVNVSGSNSLFPHIGPAINENSETLYYASNRSDGQGGYDVWYVEVSEDGSLGRAINAGPVVNNEADQITPFYDDQLAVLYFSDDTEGGFGGFDVYKVYKESEGWSTKEHMPRPINSGADDAYFAYDGVEELGYMISNRTDSFYNIVESIDDQLYEVSKRFVDVTVMGGLYFEENERAEPVQFANLEVFDRNNGSLLSMQEVNQSGYALQLKEGREYRLVASASGWEPVSKDLNLMQVNPTDTFQIDLIFSVEESAEGKLIGTVFFEYDQFRLNSDAPEMLASIIEFMKENADLVIEVSGHTDSKGDDKYNLRLSEERAKAVKRYLMSKGVMDERMLVVGYGEERPIADNELEDGTDNPEGRTMNRRVEFTVAGQLID